MKKLLVDAHCDTLMRKYLLRLGGEDRVLTVSKRKLKQGGVNVQVFAIFIPPPLEKIAVEPALDMIAIMYEIIENDSDYVLLKNKEELEHLRQSDQIGVILSFEGAEPLGNNLRLFPIFYSLGIRLITITWSRRNFFGDGYVYKQKKQTNYGLTSLGKDLVREMNKTGMVIDVSHLNRAGFYDVIELSNKPIIASHSCVYNLVDHQRNLTDEQIKTIAEHNGVIGINFSPKFLSKDKEADIHDVITHIDYICQLTGNANHVGLGSDFDGIRSCPEHLENPSKIKNLIPLLKEKGYNETEIHKIMGENFIRIFQECWV